MLLLLLAGCPKPTLPPGQAVVEDIRFEGRGKALFGLDSPATLRDQMEQQASRRFVDVLGELDLGPYVGDVATLDESLLEEDGDRIVTWYQNHGWFDARFLGWEAERRRRPAPSGGPRVDLVGKVEPGPRSVMDGPVEVWSVGGGETLRRADLERLAELDAGDPFDVDAWHDSLDAIRDRLARKGWCWARVDGEVKAWPEQRRVHGKITVDRGKPCEVGPITVVGQGAIPEARILQELGFAEGDSFRPHRLDQARQKLYALGVYSTVELVPDLDPPGEKIIPLTVRLKRRPSRTIQLGPELQIETDRQQLALTADYADADVFKKLWRWKVGAEAGAAATVDVNSTTPLDEQLGTTAAPVAKLDTSFVIPGLFGGQIQLGNAAGGLLGVEPGYREFELEGSPAVTWQPRPTLAATLGYRIKYHLYFHYDDLGAIEDTRLGVTLKPSYILSIFEEKLTVDGRDDKLAPTRGAYAAVVLGEAGGLLGGDFGFFRPTADLRGYLPLSLGGHRVTTVLAARVGGGIILTWKEGEAIDVDERLYLGGGSSVRGWGERQLGPHVEEDGVWSPVGGNLALHGSAELRQKLPANFGLVLFGDVGRVWDAPDKARFGDLALSLGGGLRYTSPIGPIRADFGYVVLPGGLSYADEPDYRPWAFHLGLGEAF